MPTCLGTPPPRHEFKDIRNQRESVAEEKARLCFELNALCKKIPKAIASASIQSTRQWLAVRDSSLATMRSKTSSRAQLMSAIQRLKEFEA